MNSSLSAYTLQFLTKAATVSSWIFIPVIANGFGISYFGMGIIEMVYGISLFSSYYLFGRLSDMLGKRKLIISIGFIASSISFISQMFMHDFASMLIIQGLVGFSIGMPAAPLVAFISGFERYRRRIGRLSGFGSLGWGVGSFIAGMLGEYELMFLMSSILSVIGIFLSIGLKETNIAKIEIPLMPIKLLKKNYAVYISYFLRQLGARSVWLTFPLFLISIGADKLWIGVLYAMGSLTQFPFMELIGRAGERISDKLIIRLGLSLSALTFISYTFATNYTQILPIQLILAASWSCVYVSSLMYLLGRNVEKATSTGLLGSMISLAAAIGPFFGGSVAQLMGMSWVMYVASILAILGLLISLEL